MRGHGARGREILTRPRPDGRFWHPDCCAFTELPDAGRGRALRGTETQVFKEQMT